VPGRAWSSGAGFTLTELMVVAGLVMIACAIAVPELLGSVSRARGLAAAHFLATKVAQARTHAVARSTFVALVFVEEPTGITFRTYVDGNRNGVRSADISAQIDRPIDDRVRLLDQFPGVAIAVSARAPFDDPLVLGPSNMLSFSAAGTSSSGSVYISGQDGTQWAVRVLGATGRTRVLRYDAASDVWVDAL
jgi:Tfp pilus assembly protein FimT